MSRAALCLALAAAGCAGSSATSAFKRAGEPHEVAAALARGGPGPSGVMNGTGRPLAFLAAGGPGGAQVIAYDLQAGKVLWREPDEPGARIVVTRAAVLYARKDGTLVGRDPATGARLWDRGLGAGRLRVGYGADAEAVYDVTQDRGRERRTELVAYEARSGSVRWRVALEGEAGAPAARGGIVAVPRRSQYVSLLDAGSGEMLAHILSREEAATFVRALPEGLFFGSQGIYLASAETAGGQRETGYLQARLPPFVRAAYHWDMYRPEQADYSAIDRNRVLWRVAADGPRASFAQGLVVVHTFRFFFALDAAGGDLRWAYSHPRTDAVASERTGGALVFVAADGEFGALDLATGRRTFRATLGDGGARMIRGATFDVEGWAPAAGGNGAPEPLERTLAGILWDPDRRFVDVKVYAIDELAKRQGREVTVELLRALEGTELPPLVVQKATDALVARQDAASLALYTQALRQYTDYAEDRRPPRLEVLARAVATTRSRQVLPALLDHLRRPETPPDAIREIADAALATGAREAVGPFEEYLLQYRADPAFARLAAPLLAAAEVLLRLGGPSERAVLLFVANDPRTMQPLREFIERSLFDDPAAR